MGINEKQCVLVGNVSSNGRQHVQGEEKNVVIQKRKSKLLIDRPGSSKEDEDPQGQLKKNSHGEDRKELLGSLNNPGGLPLDIGGVSEREKGRGRSEGSGGSLGLLVPPKTRVDSRTTIMASD